MWRNWIYKLVDSEETTTIGIFYNLLMFIAIGVSVTPLMFREQLPIFHTFEIFGCSVFIFDYIAKWITADFRTKQGGVKAFILYPISGWAILDLFTILPTFNLISKGFISLRITRLAKIARLFRVFEKSNHMIIIANVIKSEAAILSNVLALCVIYIFVSALVMFNFEDNIENFLDALYWATTALTTVGYGDVCPKSDIGKIISMISSLFGVAIIALPSGIITARYLDELSAMKKQK